MWCDLGLWTDRRGDRAPPYYYKERYRGEFLNYIFKDCYKFQPYNFWEAEVCEYYLPMDGEITEEFLKRVNSVDIIL